MLLCRSDPALVCTLDGLRSSSASEGTPPLCSSLVSREVDDLWSASDVASAFVDLEASLVVLFFVVTALNSYMLKSRSS